jgi:hypothetical protein
MLLCEDQLVGNNGRFAGDPLVNEWSDLLDAVCDRRPQIGLGGYEAEDANFLQEL